MPSTSPPDAAAYGLRVEGIDPAAGLAVHDAATWPILHVRQRVSHERIDLGPRATEVGVTLPTLLGELELHRAQRSVTLRCPQRVQDTDLVHPCLWPAAAVFARWDGAETLHAGAFVDPGRRGAWVVLADKGGGKSSLLAGLALAGQEVLVDDLVVADGGDCYAGPRCIDLRPESAAQLGLSGDERLVLVRSTSRRRLMLGPCNGRWPIVGFIDLQWGAPSRVTRLRPTEALGILSRHRRVTALGAGVDQLLELSGRPMLRLTRPRVWRHAHEATEMLLEATVNDA